ncbi:MAG: hypothetical protein AAGA77_06545 [Bacteroidota bacterium]
MQSKFWQLTERYQILSFYGWWQFGVCLFAFLGLMAIWYHIGRKQKDFGQVWLALSILCWSLSGMVIVLFYQGKIEPIDELKLTGWLSILSLLNSLFILLALPWFKHIPNYIEPIIKSRFWALIVGLPFLFSLLPTLSKLITGQQSGLISELDVYYSVLTLLVLGVVLWESFVKRRLPLLAYLSILCILITFAAQLYKLSDNDVNQILFSAIFKTSLIMIFFALALSWVKDLTEKISSSSTAIHLKAFRIKKDEKSFVNKLSLQGIAGSKENIVDLSNKNYDLMTRFIIERMNGDGWLEIKPKSDSRSGKTFDINDHNEIKRLLASILDGIYGKNLWSKIEHEIPLKSLLFEMSSQRERKIRLLIPKENLEIG